MDNLAEQLRKDAAQINVEVSPQLDSRIRASLEAVTQEKSRAPTQPERAVRSPGFWWASSLTGLAAAVLVIVVVNTNEVNEAEGIVAGNNDIPLQLPDMPQLPLNVEAAMTISPLERELQNFQSDLQRAAKAVESDVEAIIDRSEPEAQQEPQADPQP